MSHHSNSQAKINRKLTSVETYLKNKYRKLDMMFTIKNGVGFYELKGEKFSQKEIDKLFPTDSLLCFSENCDTTRNWMK